MGAIGLPHTDTFTYIIWLQNTFTSHPTGEYAITEKSGQLSKMNCTCAKQIELIFYEDIMLFLNIKYITGGKNTKKSFHTTA